MNKLTFLIGTVALLLHISAHAAEPVTPLNFVRAETDNYFRIYVEQGGLGTLQHVRDITPIDEQSIVKMNRDTLYSGGIFDVTRPLTITKPDTGDRFQSLLVFNQDHHVRLIAHEPGVYVLDRDSIGTRYAMIVFRTLVDADNPEDLATARAAQDAISIKQVDPGVFDIPDWNRENLAEIRKALVTLGAYTPTTKGRFGDEEAVDPINHLIGTAVGWGGNPPEAALYIPITPAQNDGTTFYTLTLRDVPVDGFWSISVYNADGYFEKNDRNAYVVTDRNAVRNGDGSITVHFGGDPDQPNYLHIMDGWQYLVRLYQPRQEILDGSWQFPEAVLVQ